MSLNFAILRQRLKSSYAVPGSAVAATMLQQQMYSICETDAQLSYGSLVEASLENSLVATDLWNMLSNAVRSQS